MHFRSTCFFTSLLGFLIFSLAPVSVSAQDRSNNVWVFGDGIQMDFNSGVPIISTLTDFSDQLKGMVSAYSNPDSGDLLFFANQSSLWAYNEGVTFRYVETNRKIWERSQIVLPSACPRRYFIFMANDDLYHKGEFGFVYSQFDLDLNDGRGGFVWNEEWISLGNTAVLSGITAIHKRNLEGYWIIVHSLTQDRFMVFGFDGNTVSNPVVSSVGYFFRGRERAILKVSADGSKIAMSTKEGERVQLFNFDNATGRVSGPTAEIRKHAQAVEFSPDGSKLYTTERRIAGIGWRLDLWQYDVNAAQLEFSGISLQKIGEFANSYSESLGHANLANGPNGKLYLGAPTQPLLYQVENPNADAVDVQINTLELPRYLRFDDSFVNQYVGKSINFEEPDLEIDLDIKHDKHICQGDSAQIVIRNIQAGEITWIPADGLSNPKARTLKASPEKTTTYDVFFRGKCSHGRARVTINVEEKPRVQVIEKQVICEGDSVQLHAFGAQEFTWSPARGLNSDIVANPIASPSETTIYTVTGRNSGECFDRATVEVEVLPRPTFDLGPNVSICPGGRVQLFAEGGVEYKWRPPIDILGVNTATPWVSPTEDRTYYAEVKNAEGCTRVDSIRVYVGGGVSLPDNLTYTICRGNEIQLRLNGPEGKYTWSPAAGLDDPNIKQPLARPENSTVYTVRVESDCGAAETQVEVNVIDQPVLPVETITICAGQSVELNPNGDEQLEHRWEDHPDIVDPSAVNPRVQPQQSTSYFLTIGSGDCTVSGRVRVEVGAAPPLTLSPNVSICAGQSTQLRAEGADEYSWSPAAGLSDTRSANPTASPMQTTMYYVRGTIDEGCEQIDSVLVEVFPSARVVPEPAAPRICRGETIQLNLNSDVNLRTVRWIPATGLNDPGIVNPIATLNASQDYRIEYTTEDGCQGSLELSVEVGTAPLLTVDNSVVQICTNSESGIAAQVRAAGAESYTWLDAEGRVLSRAAIWEVPASQVAGRYRVIGRDGAGCSAELEVEIVTVAPPVAKVRDFYKICAGESVQLFASGGASYLWSPAEGLDDPGSATPLATPNDNREYTVEVFNEAGCSDVAKVRVEVEPSVRLLLTAPNAANPIMPGDEFDLQLNAEIAGNSQVLNKNSFEVLIVYPAASLQALPSQELVTTGLEGWELNVSGSIARGELLLSASSSGAMMPIEFSVSLRMRMLVFRPEKAVIRAEISQSDLAVNAACDLIESQVALPLAEVCMMNGRGILYSGTQFSLLQNTPNPADDLTRIVYSLGFDTEVQLLLTDNLGRVVRRIVDERQLAGTHTLEISTVELGSGQYRYSLRAGPFSATRMLIVR